MPPDLLLLRDISLGHLEITASDNGLILQITAQWHILSMCSYMHLVVPCSASKSVAVPRRLDASTVHASSLRGFARIWASRIGEADERYRAEKLYAGPGTKAAKDAGQILDAPLTFMSAGLGWVAAARRIPPYNLTLGAGGPSPLRQVSSPSRPSAWWNAVGEFVQPTRHRLQARFPSGEHVIIALSRTYLELLLPELDSLDRKALRGFTLVLATSARVPTHVEGRVVRYDSRLGAVPGGAGGALASAPQRALRHYAQLLIENPRVRSPTAHQALVDKALALAPEQIIATRERADDATIRKQIRVALRVSPISRTRLLQQFRASGVACEQHRFARLYESIASR